MFGYLDMAWRSLIAVVLAAMPALAAAQATAPDTDQALALSQAAIGAQVDDYALVRSDGGSVRLSEFRGKPLLVQFIYTGCFQACPVSVRYLQRAVATARAALGPDAFSVLTVGFNQPFDTPQAMAAFAREHAIEDRRWYFLATDTRTIAAFTRTLGFTWYATPKGFDHVAQVTVLDARGRVYRQIYGERFEAPLLVEPLKQLITGAPVAQGDWRAWLEKVRLFCTVYDRSSGRYRLDYSLFIEIFAGLTIASTVIFGLLREWRRQRR
ncbi:MAG TPA: SCO family protein [Burkholderiales bacterium]|nr:SCO family protein [Burkholderiales bacterium]